MIDTAAQPGNAEAMGTVKDTPPEKSEFIGLRVDPNLYALIEKYATEQNVSTSKAVRILAEAGLNSNLSASPELSAIAARWSALPANIQQAILLLVQNPS